MSLQHQRAWKLAYAHSHEWVSVIPRDARALFSHERYLIGDKPWITRAPINVQSSMGRILDGNGTAEDYDSVMESGREILEDRLSFIAGLSPPFLSVEGEEIAKHSTGTGRLRWTVRRNGAVELIVSRPDGDVLRAAVPPTEYAVASIERLNHQLTIHLRHLMPLLDAIRCIGADPDDLPVDLVDTAMLATRREVDRLVANIDHWEDRAAREGHAS